MKKMIFVFFILLSINTQLFAHEVVLDLNATYKFADYWSLSGRAAFPTFTENKDTLFVAGVRYGFHTDWVELLGGTFWLFDQERGEAVWNLRGQTVIQPLFLTADLTWQPKARRAKQLFYNFAAGFPLIPGERTRLNAGVALERHRLTGAPIGAGPFTELWYASGKGTLRFSYHWLEEGGHIGTFTSKFDLPLSGILLWIRVRGGCWLGWR